MIFNSPDVTIEEEAISTVTNYSTSTACFTGYFNKGEIGTPFLVHSARQFKNLFGTATAENYNDWYQCYNYLQYSNSLYVTRAVSDSMNSFAGFPFEDTATLILNKVDFLEKYDTIPLVPDNLVKFLARTPGSYGNDLRIAIFTKRELDNNEIIFNDIRAKEIILSVQDGDYVIIVIRKDKIVEIFVKHYDTANEINDESAYIYVKNNLLDYKLIDGNIAYYDGDSFIPIYDGNLPYDNTFPIAIDDNIISLAGGFQIQPTVGNLQDGYNIFLDEGYDIDKIIGNERDNNSAISLAQARKDCIAYIGIPKIDKDYINNAKIYISTLDYSEFVHISNNYKYQYDAFTDKNLFINVAGDIAGLQAEAQIKNPWSIGAGIERGLIKNVKRIQHNFSKPEVQSMYKLSINSIRGNYIMGQKTFTDKPSSFNRVSTRILFNYLERSTSYNLRNYVFEQIDHRIISSIKSELNTFLVSVKSGNGIEDSKVQVKEHNNTIIIDIYIKPLYLAEFVQLRITNTGSTQISDYRSSTI